MYENVGRYLLGFANVLMVLTSLFLICLVLIQRGKGGGLAGAFGGAGGSSAFGTKAGDVFTRVTIFVAGFWFMLAMFLVWSNNRGGTSKFGEADAPISAVPDVDLGGGQNVSPSKIKKTVPPDPTPTNTGKDAPAVPPASTTTPPALPATPPDTTPKKAGTEATPTPPVSAPK